MMLQDQIPQLQHEQARAQETLQPAPKIGLLCFFPLRVISPALLMLRASIMAVYRFLAFGDEPGSAWPHTSWLTRREHRLIRKGHSKTCPSRWCCLMQMAVNADSGNCV
jgi:hypothetical protein